MSLRCAGLTLTSTGKPGAVMTQCFSYDQTTDHVFYTHLKDPAMSKNRLGGSYPFNLEGDNQCIIQVRNTTDEPARFTFQIDWPGGSYTLPVRVVAPQQQAAIDVRKLRDGQIPDSLGRVIPLEVTRGQTTWNEHSQQALVGRVETYTVMGRMSSTSFSCPTPCCPPVSFIVFCQPGEVSGVPGDTRLVQLFETRRRECDGAEFGPFNITAIATWTSESSSVVEVGSVSESGCELSYESVGQTDIIAQYESVQYQFAPEEGGICSPILVPIIHSCPVQVIDFTKKVLNAPLLAAGMDEPSWRGLDARCQDELS